MSADSDVAPDRRMPDEALVDAAVGPLEGTHLVINELDYDQPQTDQMEFIEVLNPTPATISLAGVHLELVDGASGMTYSRYALADAAPSLASGAMLVLGDIDLLPNLPEGVATLALVVRVQNGPSDGLRLTAEDGSTIDAVSYGGSLEGLTEGGPPEVADGEEDPLGSIGRCGRGRDSDDNASDFFAMQATPGRENRCTVP